MSTDKKSRVGFADFDGERHDKSFHAPILAAGDAKWNGSKAQTHLITSVANKFNLPKHEVLALYTRHKG